jgi:hypothetical protein
VSLWPHLRKNTWVLILIRDIGVPLSGRRNFGQPEKTK